MIEISKPHLVREQCMCGHIEAEHLHGKDCQNASCVGKTWACHLYRVVPQHYRHNIANASEWNNSPVAYLPHSCDEWVIGGRAEVEEMIAELREVLKQL